MNDLVNMEPHWMWMAIAAVLAIAEMIAPGFFLIWLGGAALLTGMATLVFDLGGAVQFILFAVLAVAAVYAGRRWFRSEPGDSADPLLNNRAARLIGNVVPVVAAIENGRGRVKIADGEWPARGPDTPLGANVRVTGADGGVLLVEAV